MNKTVIKIFILIVLLVFFTILYAAYIYVSQNTSWLSFIQKESGEQVPEEIEELVEVSKTEVNSIVAKYNAEAAPDVEVGLSRIEADGNNSLSGTLVISGNKAPVNIPRVYGLDLDSNDRAFVNLFPEVSEEPHLFATAKNGSLGTSSVLFAALTNNDPNDPWIIAEVDRATRESKTLESTTGVSERNLDWSSELGLLALQRGESDKFYSELLNVNNWEIVVVNPEDDVEVVTIPYAIQPRWISGANGFAYLKEDGLYFYSLSTNSERKLFGVGFGIVVATSMIDVSPDGNYLVWSTAKKGLITTFSLSNDGDVVSVEPVSQISNQDTEYYWPTFSPDSNYLATQAIGIYDEELRARPNPRLEIYDLSNGEKVYEKSLEEFNFNALFIDDWISQ